MSERNIELRTIVPGTTYPGITHYPQNFGLVLYGCLKICEQWNAVGMAIREKSLTFMYIQDVDRPNAQRSRSSKL